LSKLNIYSFVLEKVPAPSGAPRYGVTYEDISTREERDHWIAGSSLKVIDVQSGEVLAERIGYKIDRAQGSRARGTYLRDELELILTDARARVCFGSAADTKE